MKKIALLSILLAFTISGCITFHNSVPDDMTVREKVKDNTSVKILGKTEGKADVMIIFGFIVLGDGNKVGAFPSIISPLRSPKIIAEQAASYKSLENYPDADRVLDPTFKTTVNDYFIFQSIQSAVQGTAVQFLYK